MTPKVTVTFVVGLIYFMTPKGQGVIRGRRDLLNDLEGQLDLWPWPLPEGQAFDLTDDHKCPGNTIMRLGSHGVPYFQSMFIFSYADKSTP